MLTLSSLMRSKNTSSESYILFPSIDEKRRWGSFCITRNVTQKVRSRRDGRDPRTPQKPRFWACQKVVPPPCKNVQKMGFLGEKACIFGQFVHNFAQK
jgi:hypothetical protein